MSEALPWEWLVGAVALAALMAFGAWHRGRPFAPGVFRASRLSRGNHLFPTQVLITPPSLRRRCDNYPDTGGDSRLSDAEGRANRSQRSSRPMQSGYALGALGREDGRPSELLPSATCGSESCRDSLADQVPLKLGHGRERVGQEPARGGRGVDGLVEDD
jgi:hypothetical protein